MSTFRVSHLELYRGWLADEDADMGWLLNALTNDEPTSAMVKGTAFHKALELAPRGEFAEISANGYTFRFEGDFALDVPSIREVRHAKDYGGITVSGQVDTIHGNLISDYKSTSQFDAERYLRGYSWRYYLDIFKADRFRWHVFEMKEDAREGGLYHVNALHTLEQHRYPDMERDCRELAQDFRRFVEHHRIQPAPILEAA